MPCSDGVDISGLHGMQTYAWGDPADGPMKERIARWTIAIVYALKMHLRRSKRAPNELLVSCPAASCDKERTVYVAYTYPQYLLTTCQPMQWHIPGHRQGNSPITLDPMA